MDFEGLNEGGEGANGAFQSYVALGIGLCCAVADCESWVPPGDGEWGQGLSKLRVVWACRV